MWNESGVQIERVGLWHGVGRLEGLIATIIDYTLKRQKGTDDSILCHEFDSIFVEYFPD